MFRDTHAIERVLSGLGIALLAWTTVVWIDASSYQARARSELLLPAPPSGSSSHQNDSPIGVLEFPRLGLSVAVVQGDDESALRLGAGHLPDTPFPWEEGNSAFAGHRDTFFRGLKDAHVGDAISLVTTRGTFAYRVRRIRIVAPDNLSVLSDHEGADLTLITCYPFTYLGSAPRRFVIHAERSAPGSL